MVGKEKTFLVTTVHTRVALVTSCVVFYDRLATLTPSCLSLIQSKDECCFHSRQSFELLVWNTTLVSL